MQEKRKKNVRSFFRNLSEEMLRLLYPERCPFCDRVLYGREAAEYVCADCLEKLVFVRDSYCMKCGKPLIFETQEYCPDCRHRKHYYTQARSLLVYKGEVRHSLNRFKSANRRDYAFFYGSRMAEDFSEWMKHCRVEVLVPIPMHPVRKRERGYNQSEVLAREISRRSGIPADPGMLIKQTDTRQQKRLDAAARMENMRGAFSAGETERKTARGPGGAKASPAGKRILLIDDIYTTGATSDMAAKALFDAGAEAVYVLCAACVE